MGEEALQWTQGLRSRVIVNPLIQYEVQERFE